MPECLMNTSHSIADRTAGAEETAATETAEKGWPKRQMRKRNQEGLVDYQPEGWLISLIRHLAPESNACLKAQGGKTSS